jgi:hypothetical protein
MLSAAAVVAAGLLVPSAANAAIPQVFTKTSTPINCTVQASGQRFCGTATAQILSWDGIPLDVSVAFPPAPAEGADGPYPVISIYHGWGGTKLGLTSTDVQRALTRGYAVFTMTVHPDVSGRPAQLLMHERIIEHINKHDGVRWCTFDELADDFVKRAPRKK